MRALKERLKNDYGSSIRLSSTCSFFSCQGETPSFLKQELDVVATACEKRKADFLTGRYCARRVLGKLGVKEGFIPVSSSRAPQWPKGVTGSITHTRGYCAAIGALTRDFVAIGIDGQHMESGRITEGMKKMILRPEEDYSTDFDVNLVFSAKEALFKSLNPLVEKFFGFHGARVERICPLQKTLTISLVDDSIAEKALCLCGNTTFTVLYETFENIVVTVIAQKRPSLSSNLSRNTR